MPLTCNRLLSAHQMNPARCAGQLEKAFLRIALQTSMVSRPEFFRKDRFWQSDPGSLRQTKISPPLPMPVFVTVDVLR